MAEAIMAQTTSDGPLLQVRNVDIEYRTRERQVRATHDVSFDVCFDSIKSQPSFRIETMSESFFEY